MSSQSPMSITPAVARRLAIARQSLAGPYPEKTAQGILNVIRQLGCLQLDPTSAVARSHLLVLWSRLGQYDLSDLDNLLWQERHLFEYWAHAASIVLIEDYPIHKYMMQTVATGESDWGQSVRKWVAENIESRNHILTEIEQRGPLPSKHFEDKSVAGWYSSGWTSTRNVSQMLQHLWHTGAIMVSNRKGGTRFWDLTDRVLPDWTPREVLEVEAVVGQAAQKSLRALGVATARQIGQHFTRHRYPGLKDVLKHLEGQGIIQPVQIVDGSQKWPDTWYIHRDDMALLEKLDNGEWLPRTTLLSPFDNLICDRARTEQLFNFDFRIEIYVPKTKRQYGYFVLPILHEDRLIGRIDPLMDRKNNQLKINAVYAEPGAPVTRSTARAIGDAVKSLGEFLGAKTIQYTSQVPDGWKSGLRSS